MADDNNKLPDWFWDEPSPWLIGDLKDFYWDEPARFAKMMETYRKYALSMKLSGMPGWAPPLRTRRDYAHDGRKTFIVEPLNGSI